MGNQMRRLAMCCRNCFTMVRESTPLHDHHDINGKMHDHVNLSKNPSSDVSQIIDQSKLSFALENCIDQSFDSCKLPKSPQDADTSITVTQPSTKNNISPSKNQITKALSNKQYSKQLSDSDNLIPQAISMFHKEKNLTEESPMLQQTLKSEPTSYREGSESQRERGEIQEIDNYDLENLEDVGSRAMKQYNDIVQDDQGFQFLFSQDGIVLYTKDYQTEEKFLITQLKYSYKLNTTLIKYEAFQRDGEKQKQVEPSIEIYNIMTSYDNYQLIMMRQKKIVFLDAKEYYYVKYFQKDADSYKEVCKSVNISEVASPIVKRVLQKGQIYLAGQEVKEIADHIEIEGYIEANLKLKLPFSMIKKVLCQEFQAMVERQKKYFMDE